MTTTIKKRRLVPLLLATCFGAAVAAPTGQQVVAGQATFSQQGNVFSITNTPGTIINWQSFSINEGEVTRFVQQSSNSAVLNRIVGQDPSRIMGALQSNGKVFLINPNGVLFGRDSRVDVNGLVASSLNISNADFLAGKRNFTAGAVAGEVRNEGAITTPAGGQVFLIAPNVTNAGIITSPRGDVVLAAGHSVQLVDSRDPDLQVVVSAPADQTINLGQVVAQGGRIGIYGALVNQRGIVNANSAAVGENGKIVLKASRDTVLEQGSVTSATGVGTGGEVHLLGERVSLTGNAQVDASGAFGGGTVLVGGDWQGKNTALPNARETLLGKDASIRADATTGGDGGKVVLWSDVSTSANGSISAQGGRLGGNGGRIETSGHSLAVDGIKVNAGAARGKAGTWLLDPYDIEVAPGGLATVTDVASAGAGVLTGLTKIAAATLTGAAADIVLQAQHDITVTDAISTSKNVNVSAGNDINVNANVITTGGDLTFSAGNAFNLAAGVQIKGNHNINLVANQMNLAGDIGKESIGNVTLSLDAQSADRMIRIGGTSYNSELSLDPAALSRFTVDTLSVGGEHNTAGISVDGEVAPKGDFLLGSSGPIWINGTVALSNTGSFTAKQYGIQGFLLDVSGPITAKNVTLQGDGLRINAPITATNGVTLMPHRLGTEANLGTLQEGDFSLDQDMLQKVNAPSLTIATVSGQVGQQAGIIVSAAINLATHPFGTLTLDAGTGDITMNSVLAMASGVVSLTSTSGIYQNEGSGLQVDQLAVKANNVQLDGDNKIGTIAGSATGGSFVLNASSGVRVGKVADQTGISAAGGDVEVRTSGGLTVDSVIDAGASRVIISAGSVDGGGSIKADAVQIDSDTGIGTAATALNTETKRLQVRSYQLGAAPINISNTGDLSLEAAVQVPGGDTGTENTGAITIHTTGNLTVPASIESAPSLASTGESGVPAVVSTRSGAISLSAGGSMVIGGSVMSTSGDISLTAGSQFNTLEGALVASDTGAIKIAAAAGSVAPETVVGQPDKVSISFGQTPGLPTLEQCIANPSASCYDHVLPAYATCSANPDTFGCAPVMARQAGIEACMKNAIAANCSVVLPALVTCQADAGAYGCGATLARQKFVSCVADASAAGCDAVLPSLAVCKLTPSAEGCGAVMKKTFDYCLTSPNDARCVGVLPTISQCVLNKSTDGCQAVLPTMTQCIASPTLQGCSAVLPSLNQCVTNPALRGCEAVLPNPDFCGSHPQDASCRIFDPAPRGGGDSKSPVTRSVQETVTLINGSTGKAPATSGGQTSSNDGSSDKPSDKQPGPAAGENSGAKNEKPATKTYCN